MDFNIPTAQRYIPDGTEEAAALARTTHLGIGAHHDDLEIMAIDGILRCYQQADQWFTGVTVTNGRGSSRRGPYADYDDDRMQAVRAEEQRKAAVLGEYAAQFLLDFPSAAVKDPTDERPVDDLEAILRATRPDVLYTHNPADKHDSHIGVIAKTIAAVRRLPADERPARIYGCEVWRDLDWMRDEDKIAFDTSARPGLQTALLGVFDSQVSGGKRYDLATMGRRAAHATYFVPRAGDAATGLVFAMDLTPLAQDDTLSLQALTEQYLQRFVDDVRARITTITGS